MHARLTLMVAYPKNSSRQGTSAILCYLTTVSWGRPGFDVGYKTWGACRGAGYLVNPSANL